MMSLEYWILGVAILTMGGFFDWRYRRLLKRIENLEEREIKAAKEAAREETRDIVTGIFSQGKIECSPMYYSYRERAEKALDEYIIDLVRNSITRKVAKAIESSFESNIMIGMNEIDHKVREAISNIPKLRNMTDEGIRNANARIDKEGINYKELKARIDSPEFIQDIISRINVLQLRRNDE